MPNHTTGKPAHGLDSFGEPVIHLQLRAPTPLKHGHLFNNRPQSGRTFPATAFGRPSKTEDLRTKGKPSEKAGVPFPATANLAIRPLP